MTLQIIDWVLMDKKGIAGRAQLSDGVSSMTCMVSKTLYEKFVSKMHIFTNDID